MKNTKPIQIRLRYVLIIAASLLVMMAAILLLLKDTSGQGPLRQMWSGGDTGGDTKTKAKLTFQSHKIQRKNTRLTVKRKKETSNIQGISPGNSISLEPGLKGKYIMDFFALTGNKNAFIRQLNGAGETVRELPLDSPETANSFQRFQVPLELNGDHRLELHIGKGEFGFIGRPVFYPPVKERERRFVFLVMADTLRWDKLGVYDSSLKTSPRIDGFARDAVVFDQAYSTAPWTLPSHMSMFTGLFPDKHGVNYGNNTLPKGVKSLMDVLGRRFMTYSFNESHFVSARFGFDRGFDLYTEMQDTKPREKTKRLLDKARRWVEMEKSGFAFFFLHTYQLHHPYYPEIKLANEYYKRAGIKGFRKNLVSIYDFISGGRDIYRDAPPEEKAAIQHVYEAGVYTFDNRFGEFLDFLKQRGIYDSSTIILLSDHGEEFRDHGGWEHSHSLYNELIKIPLIVKFPGNRYAGERVDRLTSITDIIPGVLDIYDIPADLSYAIDGRSFMAIMEGKETKRKFLLSYLAPNALRMVPRKIALISDGLKFIYNNPRKEKDGAFFKTKPPDISSYEMFDIFKDPYDRSNVFNSHKKWLRMFIRQVKTLKFKTGKKGFLKGMEEQLKSLGYL